MNRARLALALGLGSILLLPSAARAFLSEPGKPQKARCQLVCKVDKATVRAPSPDEDRPVAADAAPAPAGAGIPVVREANPELLQSAALRIFLIATPHNRRAPPAA